MRTATVYANSEREAYQKCLDQAGFYPSQVRRVDSGDNRRAYLCFESHEDARIWDNQK